MAVDMIARMMAMGSGGGSGDSYTKAETDQLLDGKADLVDGKIPAAQLPSYVDDVLEYASTSAFPENGESGKIYISTDTNKTYRWGGSAYVEISKSIALGETASTAYPGHKGKANADAIAAIKDGTNIDSFADVETALAAKLNANDVDDALSGTSTNPVQNKAVQAPIARIIDAGSKNLLHFDNVCVLTADGVTFAFNPDGTISTSGTPLTRDTYCSLALGGTSTSDQIHIDRFCDGNHILAGCPAGGNYANGYSMYATSGTYVKIDKGNGILLDSSAFTNIIIIIMIRKGTNADGLVFKPMLCTAEDWAVSHKFAPYAPTNREVYATINPSQFSSISAVNNLVSNIMGGYAKIGKIVILNVRCTVTTGFSESWTIFASGLPRPMMDSATSVVAVTNNQKADIAIMSDGRIASSSAIAENAALILSAVYISQ